MADHVLFVLADDWALGYDPKQWILLKRRNSRTQTGWKPVSFIASEKRILFRVLREKDIRPTPEAQKKLDALPERFRDWRVISNVKGVA